MRRDLGADRRRGHRAAIRVGPGGLRPGSPGLGRLAGTAADTKDLLLAPEREVAADVVRGEGVGLQTTEVPNQVHAVAGGLFLVADAVPEAA